jgi:hypothetical protein
VKLNDRRGNNMDVADIINEYFKNSEYDGLLNPDDTDCCCHKDNLFEYCGGEHLECELSFFNNCVTCVNRVDCGIARSDFDYIVSHERCWKGKDEEQ